MSMMILEPLKIPLSDFLDAELEVHNTDALTGIHRRIHCAATPDASEHDEDETELDRIAIDYLLDTLAEVALAIARRGEQLDR